MFSSLCSSNILLLFLVVVLCAAGWMFCFGYHMLALFKLIWCGRAYRQRRREVVSEGDGEDDDQEE